MFNDIIKSVAFSCQLQPDWIKAICQVESNMDPWATRFEPNWEWYLTPKVFSAKTHITEKTEAIHQATSWGLMQVMGAVAREQGFEGPLPSLCDPRSGLIVGCMKLSALVKKHGNIIEATQAYNAGKPGRTAGLAYYNKVEKAWYSQINRP